MGTSSSVPKNTRVANIDLCSMHLERTTCEELQNIANTCILKFSEGVLEGSLG